MRLGALAMREVPLSRPTPNPAPNREAPIQRATRRSSSSVYVLKMVYDEAFKYKIRPSVLLRRCPRPRK